MFAPFVQNSQQNWQHQRAVLGGSFREGASTFHGSGMSFFLDGNGKRSNAAWEIEDGLSPMVGIRGSGGDQRGKERRENSWIIHDPKGSSKTGRDERARGWNGTKVPSLCNCRPKEPLPC